MIEVCAALDRDHARHLLVRHARRGTPMVEGVEQVAWIGIEPDSSPLRRWPQPMQLLLRIPDANAARDAEGTDRLVSTNHPREEHADAVRLFVAQLASAPLRYALLVHCTMGWSRSPAVALWVRERYGIAEPAWMDTQKFAPNLTLSRLLREAERG